MTVVMSYTHRWEAQCHLAGLCLQDGDQGGQQSVLQGTHARLVTGQLLEQRLHNVRDHRV